MLTNVTTNILPGLLQSFGSRADGVRVGARFDEMTEALLDASPDATAEEIAQLAAAAHDASMASALDDDA